MNATDKLIERMLDAALEAQKGVAKWGAAMDCALAVESALNRRELPFKWDPRAARKLMRDVSNSAVASGERILWAVQS